jgi:hypothetical protein
MNKKIGWTKIVRPADVAYKKIIRLDRIGKSHDPDDNDIAELHVYESKHNNRYRVIVPLDNIEFSSIIGEWNLQDAQDCAVRTLEKWLKK